MSITATVKNGVVVLPPHLKLPDGFEVELTIPEKAAPQPISGADFNRLWKLRSRLDKSTADTIAQNVAEINQAECES